MSFELSPQTSTGERGLSIVRRRGSTLPETLQKIAVFRLWSGDPTDLSDANEDAVEPRSKWNMLLGILVVVAVSGGFWAGVGFFIAHLLR